MTKIFITGSADGLGLLSAKSLIENGHQVVLHTRNEARKKEVLNIVQGSETVLIGDLSSIDETIKLAEEINGLGAFDAIIHNAGVYTAPARQLFLVNTIAPYILTCLVQKPKRLIYLSSGMHLGGHLKPDNLKGDFNQVSYSDTKLHILMLSQAVSRIWTNVYSNAVDPGWVPTKMGGKNAPDNLQKGFETQTWLAVSNEEKAKVSGRYFFHKTEKNFNPEAQNILLQEQFLSICQEITGISLPK